MNIYQMYYYNNKKFGFWVRRNSWENIIAKIILIENVIEGQKILGKYPYYKNQKVFAEFYKIDSLAENLLPIGNAINIGEISCPGTYAYFLIDFS